jgi:hypothetical protein
MTEIVRAQSVQLTLLLDLPGTWRNLPDVSCDEYLCYMPIQYATPYVRDWLERQLTLPWHRRLGGGFEIYVNGVSWTGKCYDDVGLVMSWLSAIEQLLDGRSEVHTWVWDESSLHLLLDGDDLVMFDQRWEKFDSKTWFPIKIDFVEFVERILQESKYLSAWVRAMKTEIAMRYPLEDIWQANRARHAEEQQTQIGITPRNEIEHLGEILKFLPYELEPFIERIESKLNPFRSG